MVGSVLCGPTTQVRSPCAALFFFYKLPVVHYFLALLPVGHGPRLKSSASSWARPKTKKEIPGCALFFCSASSWAWPKTKKERQREALHPMRMAPFFFTACWPRTRPTGLDDKKSSTPPHRMKILIDSLIFFFFSFKTPF